MESVRAVRRVRSNLLNNSNGTSSVRLAILQSPLLNNTSSKHRAAWNNTSPNGHFSSGTHLVRVKDYWANANHSPFRKTWTCATAGETSSLNISDSPRLHEESIAVILGTCCHEQLPDFSSLHVLRCTSRSDDTAEFRGNECCSGIEPDSRYTRRRFSMHNLRTCSSGSRSGVDRCSFWRLQLVRNASRALVRLGPYLILIDGLLNVTTRIPGSFTVRKICIGGTTLAHFSNSGSVLVLNGTILPAEVSSSSAAASSSIPCKKN